MSPSSQEVQNKLRFLMEDARRTAGSVASEIKKPGFAAEHIDAADRVGQVLAFFFIGPVVVVSLQLIVVLNELMVQILGTQPLGAGQDSIFAWLVTGITGGAFVVAAWMWFVFVRSGAFGWFTWRELDE